MLNYKAILARHRLLSGAAGHRQSDDDCLRQRKFSEAGAKPRASEQHSGSGILRADSNAPTQRERRRVARGPQKTRTGLSFDHLGRINKSKTWMPATSAG